MSDEKIIELFLSRDEKAIELTAERYERYCLQIALNILHNHSDAEECVNDAYLRLWNSIPPACPQSLRTFLARIVRNLSIDRYRSSHRGGYNSDMEVSLEGLMEELGDCIPDDDEIPYAVSEELPSLFDAFLETESSLNRKLFVGRYWHGYSMALMADCYGISEDAVESRLRRIRGRLRMYLEERGIQV